jgi:hypothetical protein
MVHMDVNVHMVIQELIVKHVGKGFCFVSFDVYSYYLVTGLVPEELLPLLLKEAAGENAEEGREFFLRKIFGRNCF